MRLVAVLMLVAACGRLHFDATGDGGSVVVDSDAIDAATCTAEICNGIDDDCDGLVDEGCPCTPFSTQIPSQVVNESVISTGDGWITSDGAVFDLIGADGSFTLGPATTAGNQPTHGTIAWNGHELAFLDQTTNQLDFAAPDGTPTNVGPVLDLGSLGSYRIDANATGFDIANGNSDLAFVTTDANGDPIASTLSPAPPNRLPLGLVQRNHAPLLEWDQSGSILEAEGTPPDLLAEMIVEAAGGEDGGIATDGTTVIVVDSFFGGVFRIDDSGVAVAPLAGLDEIADVGWTGSGWDLVTYETFGGMAELRRVHLDAMLADVSNDLLATIPYTSQFESNVPTIASDARRTLITWAAQADGGPEVVYLIASCH